MPQFRIRVKNGGAEYRVPEDMIPSVAFAMLDGGTAERLEEPGAAAPKVETASVAPRNVRTATKPRTAARQTK